MLLNHQNRGSQIPCVPFCFYEHIFEGAFGYFVGGRFGYIDYKLDRTRTKEEKLQGSEISLISSLR